MKTRSCYPLAAESKCTIDVRSKSHLWCSQRHCPNRRLSASWKNRKCNCVVLVKPPTCGVLRSGCGSIATFSFPICASKLMCNEEAEVPVFLQHRNECQYSSTKLRPRLLETSQLLHVLPWQQIPLLKPEENSRFAAKQNKKKRWRSDVPVVRCACVGCFHSPVLYSPGVFQKSFSFTVL